MGTKKAARKSNGRPALGGSMTLNCLVTYADSVIAGMAPEGLIRQEKLIPSLVGFSLAKIHHGA